VFVQAGLGTGWLDEVEAVAETMDGAAVDGAAAAGAAVDGAAVDGAAADGVAVGGTAVSGAALDGAVRWLSYAVETELLMNEIADSANRISALVGAAKQYSQLGRAPYQVTDLHELLDSTLLMLGRKIGSGITVVKDYDRTLPPVPGYPAELNQVWTNLIDNAASAMKGEGTLTVRTALDRDQALIEFRDTGPGVPAEVRERIFEPFFTTKPVGEGTGLGLDISWRIVVAKHHGDLRVESSPGDTRFQVRLPLTAPEPEAGPETAPETQPGTGPEGQSETGRQEQR
jgi:signal transduction histidine kinase